MSITRKRSVQLGNRKKQTLKDSGLSVLVNGLGNHAIERYWSWKRIMETIKILKPEYIEKRILKK